jgi:tetratricopeptide (TPR) repeat protein
MKISVVEPYGRRHARHTALAERRDALRCWLASFVLHLALAIGLGSLLLPQLKSPPRPLLLSFAARLSDAEQSTQVEKLTSAEMVLPVEPFEAEGIEPPPADDPAPTPTPTPHIDLPLEKPTEKPAPVSFEQPPPPEIVRAGDDSSEQLASMDEPPRQADVKPSSNRGAMPAQFRRASLSGQGVTGGGMASGGMASGGMASGEPMAESDPEQRRMDEIVEQFICYDIGALRGAAGQQALRAFNQLGPEAIPALVRGLNRSASIHASCPVCVITTKLQNELRDNQDPSLLRYAIDNIGRDVPDTAPHRARLTGLAKQLVGSTEIVRERLNSADRTQQVAAMEELFDRHAGLPEREKLPLSEPLIAMVHGADFQLALAAHRLMALMTPAKSSPPAENLLRHNRSLAAQQWRDHWRRIGVRLQLDQAAYQELASALESEDRIQRQGAALAIATLTRRISDGQRAILARHLMQLLSFEDDDSQQAAQAALIRLASGDRNTPREPTPAQWRLYWHRFEQAKLLLPRAQSFLSMARRFETRGQVDEAAERYRKIVTEFPNTPSATEAERRLLQLGAGL